MDCGGRIMSITVTTEKQFESDIEAFLISAEGGYIKGNEHTIQNWAYIRINWFLLFNVPSRGSGRHLNGRMT